MAIQGQNSTIPIIVETIEYHTKSVKKSAPNVFVISDLIFMSYYKINQTFQNTSKIVQSSANYN